MGLGPGYGETPLEGEELDALDPRLISHLGTASTKAAIFDLESALQAEVRDRFMARIDHGDLTLEEILREDFLVELHRTLYDGIWTWAGHFRRTGLNIGAVAKLGQ